MNYDSKNASMKATSQSNLFNVSCIAGKIEPKHG